MRFHFTERHAAFRAVVDTELQHRCRRTRTRSLPPQEPADVVRSAPWCGSACTDRSENRGCRAATTRVADHRREEAHGNRRESGIADSTMTARFGGGVRLCEAGGTLRRDASTIADLARAAPDTERVGTTAPTSRTRTGCRCSGR